MPNKETVIQNLSRTITKMDTLHQARADCQNISSLCKKIRELLLDCINLEGLEDSVPRCAEINNIITPIFCYVDLLIYEGLNKDYEALLEVYERAILRVNELKRDSENAGVAGEIATNYFERHSFGEEIQNRETLD